MITVLGLGFVGLTTALGFAHLGYKVYGVDVNEERVATIKKGKLPFLEPDMESVLQRELDEHFFVTEDASAAIGDSDYVFYCVGTPYGKDGAANLDYLFAAIDTTLAAVEDDRFRVLVTKSTIPPGTTAERIAPYVSEHARKKENFGVANNPEFLREGHCWQDFMEADRIVLGVTDDRSREMLTRLYEPMEIPIKCVSTSTGEFVKYLSNTMLATMISYSNEMAGIADAIGDIQTAEAFRILHMDKRWGGCSMTSYVYPGCGYGGYCLPKDTNALLAQAEAKGAEVPILRSVIDTNRRRPQAIAGKILRDAGKDAKDTTVGIMGLSFKPNSDDVRDTPAAHIIRALLDMDCRRILAYDPVAMEEFRRHYPELAVELRDSAKAVYNEADVLAIVTAWEEFREIPTMGDKQIVDCRYML